MGRGTPRFEQLGVDLFKASTKSYLGNRDIIARNLLVQFRLDKIKTIVKPREYDGIMELLSDIGENAQCQTLRGFYSLSFAKNSDETTLGLHELFKAAEGGSVDANIILGELYEYNMFGRKTQKSSYYWKNALEKNDSRAKINIALNHFRDGSKNENWEDLLLSAVECPIARKWLIFCACYQSAGVGEEESLRRKISQSKFLDLSKDIDQEMNEIKASAFSENSQEIDFVQNVLTYQSDNLDILLNRAAKLGNFAAIVELPYRIIEGKFLAADKIEANQAFNRLFDKIGHSRALTIDIKHRNHNRIHDLGRWYLEAFANTFSSPKQDLITAEKFLINSAVLNNPIATSILTCLEKESQPNIANLWKKIKNDPDLAWNLAHAFLTTFNEKDAIECFHLALDGKFEKFWRDYLNKLEGPLVQERNHKEYRRILDKLKLSRDPDVLLKRGLYYQSQYIQIQSHSIRDQARSLIKLAADKGLVEAQKKIALIYLEEDCDIPKSFKYFEQAAQNGDAYSNHQIGLLNLFLSPKISEKERLDILKLQSTKNNVYAMFELACHYYQSASRNSFWQEIGVLLRNSAIAGHPLAGRKLAKLTYFRCIWDEPDELISLLYRSLTYSPSAHEIKRIYEMYEKKCREQDGMIINLGEV